MLIDLFIKKLVLLTFGFFIFIDCLILIGVGGIGSVVLFYRICVII